ncbi:hypothetical protein ILUMI_19215 [Ignelater luminosus]|uniref:Uncharacterized protein n=1 Tax=Ignelater luminosus TaxID=2038154 RepID=A0A8K0CGK6_IGNLU|nr:hypothetical protein ILUMI_19215 [Ignelater luminosus]
MLGFNDSGVTLVSYVSKKGKVVLLRSTMHRDGKNDVSSGDFRKLDIIAFYSHTKGAVDVVDQMKGTYSVARTKEDATYVPGQEIERLQNRVTCAIDSITITTPSEEHSDTILAWGVKSTLGFSVRYTNERQVHFKDLGLLQPNSSSFVKYLCPFTCSGIHIEYDQKSSQSKRTPIYQLEDNSAYNLSRGSKFDSKIPIATTIKSSQRSKKQEDVGCTIS